MLNRELIFREIFKIPIKIAWWNIICVKGRDIVVKKLTSGSWLLSFKESFTIKGLKFKVSKVVVGAMIVYILAELNIELITTISSALQNDWPIVQKSYLNLISQTFHFLPELFPALHCFKAEILIDKNIATFQFLCVLNPKRDEGGGIFPENFIEIPQVV